MSESKPLQIADDLKATHLLDLARGDTLAIQIHGFTPLEQCKLARERFDELAKQGKVREYKARKISYVGASFSDVRQAGKIELRN